LHCLRLLRISQLDEELWRSEEMERAVRAEEVVEKDTMRIEDEIADIVQSFLSLF
jgi:hypothetical protein